MEMDFDIARYDATKRSDKIVYLPWVGATDRISYTYPINTNSVNRLVNRKQID